MLDGVAGSGYAVYYPSASYGLNGQSILVIGNNLGTSTIAPVSIGKLSVLAGGGSLSVIGNKTTAGGAAGIVQNGNITIDTDGVMAAMEYCQKMIKFMSIIFGIMFYKVAAGLCIYFITSSLWGMAERMLLPKKQAAPTTRITASFGAAFSCSTSFLVSVAGSTTGAARPRWSTSSCAVCCVRFLSVTKTVTVRCSSYLPMTSILPLAFEAFRLLR